jgi:lactoylglutathione lyase
MTRSLVPESEAVVSSPRSKGFRSGKEDYTMRLLHTMVRVNNLEESLKFYCDVLGMKLLRKRDFPSGRFTLAFVGFGAETENAVVELTYNWDTHVYDLGNAYGHIAIGVDDIYKTCDELRGKGAKVVRAPGPMGHGGTEIAFIEDPNGYKIELIDLRTWSARETKPERAAGATG